MSSTPRRSEGLGRYTSLVDQTLRRVETEQIIARIWQKDASVWKTDAANQKIINGALGWLTVARMMTERVDEIIAFASEVRASGIKHVMILGMGGSSLCPEVFRRTFGPQDEFPQLLVLDTTDPDTIASFEKQIDIEKTLFVVASKSGSTIEPLSFYKYFYDRVRTIKKERVGENFVAITDPGTLMERMALEAGFRRIFLNPADIGGRYSALSYFGIVPAALMGLNIQELLRRAVTMMDSCSASIAANENSGAWLGCVMGALAIEGRDKLTLVADQRVSSLGLWIEQLVAESTGKEDKGIVPIAGEPLASPEAYGDDRLFVAIHVGPDEDINERLSAIEAAGHPVVHRNVDDLLELGAEFFMWEMATAVSGALLSINPFDQPNVQESKDNTNRLLDEYKRSGSLPEQKALVTDGELRIYGKVQDAKPSSDETTARTLSSVIAELLASVQGGDYIALLAYVQETDGHDEVLRQIRTRLRDKLKAATTSGYGPRFLHSTGQLHKGGANNGVYLQLTDEDQIDLKIPGEPYTFSILKQAQELGDFSSLEKRKRRALRLHLGRDTEAGLMKLLEML